MDAKEIMLNKEQSHSLRVIFNDEEDTYTKMYRHLENLLVAFRQNPEPDIKNIAWQIAEDVIWFDRVAGLEPNNK